MPDKRAIEKVTSDLSRLLQGKKFESKEDLRVYLNGIVKGGKVPDVPPKSAVDFAQDIMYEAWEAETTKERIKLAKEALSISMDCADAYNLLAEEEAKTLEETKELYEKGVEAGRRALGEEIFKENKGHFWGYVPTRPYMRSRAGLMECLWELGDSDEAVNHARQMLLLNKNDNQGIRYILIAHLSELGKYDELDRFLNKGRYKNDCGTEWIYTQALVFFVKEGRAEKAEKALSTGLLRNPYVAEYLTGKKQIPRMLPDTITLRGEDEGFCYAHRFLEAWKRAAGAIEWLKDKAGIK